MSFTLPSLPYAFDALEPYIDAKTMEIHYGKHHQTYVDNLNKAVAGTENETKPLIELVKNAGALSTAIRNNAGGTWNHTFFWNVLGAPGTSKLDGELKTAIDRDFGSFDNFKQAFTTAALGRFGSGWAWLISVGGKLSISSTPNQDSPLMDLVEEKGTPLLNLDVWEHAYYLKYQNRRADYIGAFWNVVNWDSVAKNFQESK